MLTESLLLAAVSFIVLAALHDKIPQLSSGQPPGIPTSPPPQELNVSATITTYFRLLVASVAVAAPAILEYISIQ
jgi:hypothetical protein